MNGEVSKTKRIVDRSPAYPSIDLRVAVDLSKKIFDLFSEYGFSREVASEKLGLAQNANSYRKIAALVQYGLLKREGNSYKITPLAKGIVLATDEGEKEKLLGKAVSHPKIYSTLITENSGKGLPSSLDIRLRQLNYSKDAAKSLAVIFKLSLEYSGLLKNGIVVNSAGGLNESMGDEVVNDEPTQDLQVEVPSDTLVKGKQENRKPVISSPGIISSEYIPYPLDCGIVVMFPFSMVKKMMSGDFLGKLNELEQLGKGEVDGSSTNNAPNAPVESDQALHKDNR